MSESQALRMTGTVCKQLDYSGRKGEVELETDDGEAVLGDAARNSWKPGISTWKAIAGKSGSPLPGRGGTGGGAQDSPRGSCAKAPLLQAVP